MEEIKRKNKEKTQGFGSGGVIPRLVFLGVILLSPFSFIATAEPPVVQDCIHYGYSVSNNHYFLIKSDAAVFGSNLTIEHNCNYLLIESDGNFIAESFNGSSLYFQLNPGFYNFTITGDNLTTQYNNVQLYPNALTWFDDYNEWRLSDYTFGELVELNYAKAQENWASFLTAVIIWILVVYVYWNLINSYVDRNYCEEVRK